MNFRRIIEDIIAIGVSSLIIVYGFVKGLEVSELSVNSPYFTLNLIYMDAVSSTLFFSAFIGLFGLALAYEIFSSKASIPEIKKGKNVLAIIPVYQEAEILQKSVKSLKSCNYQDLDICVVVEPEDEACKKKAKHLNCKVLTNDYPGSKSGALNTAFEEKTNYDFYAMFDADEIVEYDFISKAVGRLVKGNYEAIEGRRIPETKGVVENFSYCERLLFNLIYKFMESTGFKNVGTSACVIKRSVWEKTGGFDDMLTEDLDFHHKTFRAGINTVTDRRINTIMEAPHSWPDFWKQRKRWRKGWVEVLHKTLKGGYNNYLSLRGFYSTSRIIFGMIGIISILIIIPKMIILFILNLRPVYLLPIFIITVITALISYKDSKKKHVNFLGFNSILSVFVLPLTSYLAIKSIVEYLSRGKGEWHQIEKGK